MMNFVRKLRLEQFHRDIVILPHSAPAEKKNCGTGNILKSGSPENQPAVFSGKLSAELDFPYK